MSDTVTWVRGNHTFKTGLSVTRNRIDQNARTTYAGQVDFNTGGNTRTSNNSFADALLGNFRTYSEQALDPVGFFRFTQTEAFVADSWKVNRKLSLELGMRYQYGMPIYTQANNLANFDPSLYNPAQAVTILANGNIDPTRGGNRFNGLFARAMACRLKSSHAYPAETPRRYRPCRQALRVVYTRAITTSCRASASPIHRLTTTRLRFAAALACTTIASKEI